MPTDSDGNNTYEVTVTVSDGLGGFDSQTIAVSIVDANEFAVGTVTDANVTANSVNENATTGTLVGITAVATDPDATNNGITYSLTGNAGGRFAIHASSGVVTVANGSLLNREAAAGHTITVRATSADGSFAQSNFFVAVGDVDEFNVTAPNDTNSANNIVSENAANGTTVGLTIAAVDADATTNTITYSLDDNAGGRFAINSTTGVVTVAGGIDRETHSQHVIVVRARSADGSSSTRAFSIGVLGVNDNLPVFTSGNTATVGENQLFAKQLTAVDADLPSQTINFSIAGGADAARFDVSPTNELVFRQAPDFENPGDANSDNRYLVVVRANDGAGGTIDQAIQVQVTNVNDAPSVASPSIQATQGETFTSPIGYLLYTANDQDGDPLTISLVLGATHGSVTVQPDGTYAYTAVANFLGTDSFVFAVSDGQGGVTQGTVTIQVNPGMQPPPAPVPPPSPTPAPLPDNTGGTTTTSSRASGDTTGNNTSASASATSGESSTNSTAAMVNQITSLNSTISDKETSLTSKADDSGKNLSIGESSSRISSNRDDRTSVVARGGDAGFEYRVIREVSRQTMAKAAEQAETMALQRVDLVVSKGILWKDLDVLREQIVTHSEESPITLGTATGFASSLSVGYVIWLLRSGYIVAGVMAQLPAWGLIDPLPILSQLDDLEDGDDDSLAALVDKSNSESEASVSEGPSGLTQFFGAKNEVRN